MRFAYKYPWFRICHTRYHHFLTYVFAKYATKWGLIPTVRFDEEGADYPAVMRGCFRNVESMIEQMKAKAQELGINLEDRYGERAHA